MGTTQRGNESENIVAESLKKQGYSIVAQNWRTRWCEIDIIALKNKTVYFIEVKYRRNSSWGDGLEAINDKKRQQMEFAAELWVAQNKWNNQYYLAAASLSNEPPTLDQFIILDE